MHVEVSNPKIATWADGRVRGTQAGRTTMEISAGGIGGKVEVNVFVNLEVVVRFDAAKRNGDTWDSELSGSTAPEPYVRIDGRTYMMGGGYPDCPDRYKCTTTVRTQSPTATLEVEAWDDDFSDDDYAGSTRCARGQECPTGQGAVVEIE